MQLRFVASESAFAYFEALQGYLASHGRPVAFYSDKHSVFRVARKEAKGGQGMTQFGRALAELNIEILCANSSQAINGRAVDPCPQGRRSADRRGAGSSGSTARCRTVWSRSCAWPGSATSQPATRSCRGSWRGSTPASPSPPPTRTTATGR